jgi:hypothetical protein
MSTKKPGPVSEAEPKAGAENDELMFDHYHHGLYRPRLRTIINSRQDASPWLESAEEYMPTASMVLVFDSKNPSEANFKRIAGVAAVQAGSETRKKEALRVQKLCAEVSRGGEFALVAMRHPSGKWNLMRIAGQEKRPFITELISNDFLEGLYSGHQQ